MAQVFQNLDAALLMAVQGARLELLDPLVAWYTSLGNGGAMWIILSLAMLCWRPTRRAGAVALAAMLLGLVVTNLTLKPLVSRPRPWLAIAELAPLIAEGDPHSFPSGHTCAALAAGTAWARNLPGRRVGALALVLAVCMGLSRLYVGVHYPSDVAAGALVGVLCALAAEAILRRWRERRAGRAGRN